jgi:hypothetical protein
LLADLAFLVLGWFKLSGYFYFHRFGHKQQRHLLRTSSIVTDHHLSKQVESKSGELQQEHTHSEPSNIIGRSMSHLDVSIENEEEKMGEVPAGG